MLPPSNADDDGLLPSFFIYEHPALDHSWMETRCGARLEALLLSAHGRLAAEVGLYRALRDHPRRTRDPERANLFYVAVFIDGFLASRHDDSAATAHSQFLSRYGLSAEEVPLLEWTDDMSPPLRVAGSRRH